MLNLFEKEQAARKVGHDSADILLEAMSMWTFLFICSLLVLSVPACKAAATTARTVATEENTSLVHRPLLRGKKEDKDLFVTGGVCTVRAGVTGTCISRAACTSVAGTVYSGLCSGTSYCCVAGATTTTTTTTTTTNTATTTPMTTTMPNWGGGVNMQPSYYNGGSVTFGWSLLAQFSQVKSVRIEIEPDKVALAAGWIREALSHGYKVIATYHKYQSLGSDDPNELMAAANFWVANYARLRQAAGGDFTINLMNEWGSHKQTSASYSAAYNSAISRVRSVYTTGFIVIDLPGWGQGVTVAAAASALLSAKSGVIFSAHVYPNGYNAGASRALRPSDMVTLKQTGRPCIVGEYGLSPTGTVDVASVILQAKQSGFIGVFAWAWNGDGGNMNMVAPSWVNYPMSPSYQATPYLNQIFKIMMQ